MEYYILCPQRETEVPGLITHLISRDICNSRQVANYHKCASCVRSRIWREQRGHPPVAALNGHADLAMVSSEDAVTATTG